MLVVSYVLWMCGRGNSEQQFQSFFSITTLRLSGRHWIVDFKWMEHWWFLGPHNITRKCWQGHELFRRSSITMICLMLISSMISTFGFCEDSGWLMLGAKWCAYDKKMEYSTALYLSQWVYNINREPCPYWVLRIQQIKFFVIWLIHHWWYPSPLCIHRNSCILGSTTRKEQCLVIFIVD